MKRHEWEFQNETSRSYGRHTDTHALWNTSSKAYHEWYCLAKYFVRKCGGIKREKWFLIRRATFNTVGRRRVGRDIIEKKVFFSCRKNISKVKNVMFSKRFRFRKKSSSKICQVCLNSFNCGMNTSETREKINEKWKNEIFPLRSHFQENTV